MTINTNPSVDVAVIGGSSAGLSAALALGRARRSVAVIDDSRPRNAPAGHAHNIYTRDGTPPGDLLRIGREQLEPYGVRFLVARATGVDGGKGAFRLTLSGGQTLTAARLLLATGVADVLPEVPGLLELWGRSVFTCPYCHGWEVRDTPLAVLEGGDTAYVRMIQNWSRDLVLVTGEHTTFTNEQLGDLDARGVDVVRADVAEYEVRNGELSALHLSNGRRLERRAVFMRPSVRLRGDLHEQLGCALSDDRSRVVADEMGRTSVPGVYAAGDMVSPMAAVIVAAASGTKAAAMLNHEFVMATPKPEPKGIETPV